MAKMRCPICNHVFTGQLDSCPNCGARFKKREEQPLEEENKPVEELPQEEPAQEPVHKPEPEREEREEQPVRNSEPREEVPSYESFSREEPSYQGNPKKEGEKEVFRTETINFGYLFSAILFLLLAAAVPIVILMIPRIRDLIPSSFRMYIVVGGATVFGFLFLIFLLIFIFKRTIIIATNKRVILEHKTGTYKVSIPLKRINSVTYSRKMLILGSPMRYGNLMALYGVKDDIGAYEAISKLIADI